MVTTRNTNTSTGGKGEEFEIKNDSRQRTGSTKNEPVRKIFDIGKYRIQFTFLDIISIGVIIIGIIWFIAAEWRFKIKSTELNGDIIYKLEEYKSNIYEQTNKDIDVLSTAINSLEIKINNISNDLKILRSNNSDLK